MTPPHPAPQAPSAQSCADWGASPAETLPVLPPQPLRSPSVGQLGSEQGHSPGVGQLGAPHKVHALLLLDVFSDPRAEAFLLWVQGGLSFSAKQADRPPWTPAPPQPAPRGSARTRTRAAEHAQGSPGSCAPAEGTRAWTRVGGGRACERVSWTRPELGLRSSLYASTAVLGTTGARWQGRCALVLAGHGAERPACPPQRTVTFERARPMVTSRAFCDCGPGPGLCWGLPRGWEVTAQGGRGDGLL